MNGTAPHRHELEQRRVEAFLQARDTKSKMRARDFDHARIGAWAARGTGKHVARYATMFGEGVKSKVIQQPQVDPLVERHPAKNCTGNC